MNMQELHDKHMTLVDKVNKYTNAEERQNASIFLHAWRRGLDDAGVNVGRLIILADLTQIERGNNYNMSGGVFNIIDGKPEIAKETA
jgi:hypothetical protein